MNKTSNCVKKKNFTYFSSGGGGISCADGLLGGDFSGTSIIANGASGGGRGLTLLLSILYLILAVFIYHSFTKLAFSCCSTCIVWLSFTFLVSKYFLNVENAKTDKRIVH